MTVRSTDTNCSGYGCCTALDYCGESSLRNGSPHSESSHSPSASAAMLASFTAAEVQHGRYLSPLVSLCKVSGDLPPS